MLLHVLLYLVGGYFVFSGLFLSFSATRSKQLRLYLVAGIYAIFGWAAIFGLPDGHC